MTIKFYQMVVSIRRHKIKKINITVWSANYRTKSRDFGKCNCRHDSAGNFADQSVKCRKMLFCKIKNSLQNGDVTLPNLHRDFMSSISSHLPSFWFFREIELKAALYKGQTRGQILRKSGLHGINYHLIRYVQ